MDRSSHARFRQRLRDREPLLGTLVSLPSPEIAELLANAGFDWLFLDMEHGLLDFAAVQSIIQAAGGECPCIVRVPSNEPVWIGKALDTGAAGLIFPHINSPAEARAAVTAGKYPPEGIRSIGAARAQGFGSGLQRSVADANLETTLVPQVEHIDAARAIEEILSVPGIDAIFIGPFDLSASLGRPGDIAHSEVHQAIVAVRDACAARTTPCGIFVVDAAAARQAFRSGYSLVCVATETMLLGSAAATLIRESKG
jgi:2-dehydro-3-deoxyglucarate aldolase/4-hydroxy-2-oxoheptanedioate aldolase